MSTFIVGAILVILIYFAVRHMRKTGTGCCDTKDSCSSGSCPHCQNK
ncbi:MAG: hypothetical protein SOS22_10790 [Absicoccus sp.]|uniref:FeoB-associated Cys-rich membrane protein n=1 Tax=Absicoccus intestinalis TaxID=2926319 RepID=A0ABU4WN00_9FIRM|nr:MULTISPECIES: hypothetical protein [unclassified Absicoccus]MDX8417148.1 hypothetical protein [Absicoccus sp. CLA-KB-P134]MDY3036679.1 hypothetical protein [Absicoccus sp.]